MTTPLPSAKASVGRDMIAAAHALFSSDRLANEEELIISTCQEVLKDRPANTEAVRLEVNAIWPGAKISTDRVERALDRARNMGLIATMETLDGLDWALTSTGQLEIQSTSSWYSDSIQRLSAQVQERAIQDFGQASTEQADLWASILINIMTKAISAEETVYGGGLNRAAAGTVRPVGLDSQAMIDDIREMSLSPGTRDFLRGCLLAAIDESDPFANELVSYAATSCILHSIISGRSGASARQALGALDGETALLDTPILVELLGPRASAARIEKVIALATQSGMEVIVPDHVITELLELIKRIEDEYVPGLLKALHDGTGARIYSATVDEQVLELFLDAIEDGRFRGWPDFATFARHLGEQLISLSVIVRDHGNNNRDRVDRYVDTLQREIDDSGSHRGQKQVARDAETMELVGRARRRKTGQGGSLWPGGWVISRDRKMSSAYRKAEKDDIEPLVLSPSQWAILISEATEAPEAEELITAAASFLRQEAVLRIAVKYPPEIALTLAQSLNDSVLSDTDVRVAQLSLVDLLDDLAEGEYASGETIATAVSTKRAQRLASAGQVHREAFDASLKSMSAGAARTAGQMDILARERERAESELRTEREKSKNERDESIRLREQHEAYEALGKRRAVRVAVTVVAVLAVAFFAVLQLYGFAAGTLVGAVIFHNQAHKWVESKEEPTASLLLALIPELFGLYDIIRGL
ncbi:hypothetical protein ACAD35_02690 [Clavibacter nebraskensis]